MYISYEKRHFVNELKQHALNWGVFYALASTLTYLSVLGMIAFFLFTNFNFNFNFNDVDLRAPKS